MRKLTFSAALMFLALMVAGGARGFAGREARPADLLEILPDGGGVAVIDFQKITGSALWTSISAQQKLSSFLNKAQSDIADFGIKLNDVHTIALVFAAANLNNPTAAISGGFDQKELLDRLRASSRIKLTAEKYKGFDVYKARSVPVSDAKPSSDSKKASVGAAGNETSFAFRDASTIVIGATESVHASIDVMTGARQSVTQNTQLSDGLAQNPSAAVKFAIVVTPSMTKGIQSSELPIPDFASLKLIYGSIDVTSGIDLNATLRSDSAESAKGIADRLNGLLGMARGYLGATGNPKSTAIGDALKAVNITSINNDVKITGSLTADLLSNLFASAERKSQ
ncbi:MAG TPA: hypothetical protein VN937_12020 [Blastocatellia bacterium]|nr:hypothetical protein [Blastocatellia bacterium]